MGQNVGREMIQKRMWIYKEGQVKVIVLGERGKDKK